MQFLLPFMSTNLENWKSRPIHPRAPRDRVPNPNHDRKVMTMAVEELGDPERSGAFEILETEVLAYRIFGPDIGPSVVETTPVQVGDTIGLRYKLLPFLHCFFASRVVRVFHREPTEDGGVRSGFVYQTLTGHPELGEEVFEVKKTASGAVVFRLEAWSRPRAWYVRLVAPVARWIQKRAAVSAFRNLGSKLNRAPEVDMDSKVE